MSEDQAPETEDVYGLRTFAVEQTRHGKVLTSVSLNAPQGQLSWVNEDGSGPGGICTAVCTAPVPEDGEGHTPPDPDCHCGVYSATSLHSLRAQQGLAEYAALIVAVIATEGPAEYGPTGMRTTRGTVVAFWVREPDSRHPEHAGDAALCARQFTGARRYFNDEMMASVHRVGEPPVRRVDDE